MARCVARMLPALVAVLVSQARAEPLRAGAARVSITPDVSRAAYTLGGYADPGRFATPARGVADPCHARALVVDDGQSVTALVSVDLCFVPASVKAAVLARIRGLGITPASLVLCATHTHAGPEPLMLHAANVGGPRQMPAYSPELLDWIASRIGGCIRQALDRLAPARLGTGQRGKIGLNRNRRGEGVTDDTLTVVKVTTPAGKPVAGIFTYAAHPTFHGADMLRVSADWPGAFAAEWERRHPGMVALFINGAEGDVATAHASGAAPEARIASYAAQLARVSYDLWDATATRGALPVRVRSIRVRLPAAQAHPLFGLAALRFGARPEAAHALARRLMPAVTTLAVCRIGSLVVVCVPGEPTTAVGKELKAAAGAGGARHTAVWALANGWHGYFVTAAQYRAGGYEPSMSFHGEGGGQALVAGLRAFLGRDGGHRGGAGRARRTAEGRPGRPSAR